MWLKNNIIQSRTYKFKSQVWNVVESLDHIWLLRLVPKLLGLGRSLLGPGHSLPLLSGLPLVPLLWWRVGFILLG
jgi:hypothetical protein